MKHSIALGLVCALFASPARAGDVILPFTPGVCASVFTAENDIIASNMFVGFVRCVDLCKSIAKDCVKFTKDAYSCQTGLVSDSLDYSKKECANISDGPTRKTCELAAKTNSDVARGNLKSDLEEALGFCDSWRTECLGFCAN
ncbi:MAG TPA: hypothetical protein VMR86_17670 [Myxococcota bacterium]|nr:hypothetical protein [Myxococcota bacterium]